MCAVTTAVAENARTRPFRCIAASRRSCRAAGTSLVPADPGAAVSAAVPVAGRGGVAGGSRAGQVEGGLPSKEPAGSRWQPTGDTGMTGQSSGRATWWARDECPTTTSSPARRAERRPSLRDLLNRRRSERGGVDRAPRCVLELGHRVSSRGADPCGAWHERSSRLQTLSRETSDATHAGEPAQGRRVRAQLTWSGDVPGRHPGSVTGGGIARWSRHAGHGGTRRPTVPA